MPAIRIPVPTHHPGYLDVSTFLLDVDGTLIDSNGAHAEATDTDTVRSLIGMGSDKLLPTIASLDEQSTTGEALTRRKKELFDAQLPRLRPTRGARALLEHLRRREVSLVVATSADEEEMTALLRQAGVDDLLPSRTSSDDAAGSKPDPDIVHAALRGAERGTAVLIGDTPYDIEAANRAGIRTVAMRCGGHWTDRDLGGAVLIVDDPAALLHLLSSGQDG
jgi:HAD superfamily hydrolase (TIGR01509 family)